MTPLMHTAVSGSLQAMTLLLDKGASVNAANSAGVTALMMSVTDIDKVSLLLAKGADVNSQGGRRRCSWLRW
jgi:ankyrin repeat protein